MNLKMFYLVKKIIRHKMKRIQSKKHKLQSYKVIKVIKVTKYLCHALTIKDMC